MEYNDEELRLRDTLNLWSSQEQQKVFNHHHQHKFNHETL